MAIAAYACCTRSVCRAPAAPQRSALAKSPVYVTPAARQLSAFTALDSLQPWHRPTPLPSSPWSLWPWVLSSLLLQPILLSMFSPLLVSLRPVRPSMHRSLRLQPTPWSLWTPLVVNLPPMRYQLLGSLRHRPSPLPLWLPLVVNRRPMPPRVVAPAGRHLSAYTAPAARQPSASVDLKALLSPVCLSGFLQLRPFSRFM